MQGQRFAQADGRALVRLKWTARKMDGPLVYLAELIQKKMIQAGFPVEYEIRQEADGLGEFAEFVNGNGTTETFLDYLAFAVQIVGRQKRVKVQQDGCEVRLGAAYRLAFRFAKNSPKPAAAEFREIQLEGETPF